MKALLLVVVLAACGSPTEPSLTPSDASPEAVPLTRAEAVAIAHDAAPQAGRRVTFAEAGPRVDLLAPSGPESERIIAAIPDDRWIWVISLTSDPHGAEWSVVVIDYLDGRVYGVMGWIA